MAEAEPKSVRAVEATVNYLGDMTEQPVFNVVDFSKTNIKLRPETVRITDARALETAPSLDTEGFALVSHKSALSNFRDSDELERVYLPEIADLIKAVTGASVVISSPGPIARYADRKDEAAAKGTADAARFAHTDYSDVSARDHFLPQLMDPDEAFRRFRRITVYQTWRALSGPYQDVPLTVTDGRTVRKSDMVTSLTVLGTEYTGTHAENSSFEFSLCRYHPDHRWYYFSQMRPDEVLIFKGYDFDPEQPSRLFHTAFDDPSAPAGTPPRASVEARAFAFFE